jgi:hypothetical protein
MAYTEAAEHEATSVLKTLTDSAYTDIDGLRRNFMELIELFDEDLFEGNCDATTDFSDGTPNIRIIQEDEHDHMSKDEVDELDNCFLGYSGYYIFSA